MRKDAESLKRWLADPRRGHSLLPFAVGVSIALLVLWLREPALFVEPTLRGDDVICFAAQYGEGKTLYHHNGAAHVLPMLASWIFVHALPEVAVPYAYSLSSLFLAALAPATLLLPMMERWLPLFPQRAIGFSLLVALPLDTAVLVASLGYQHLNYVMITFVLLAFSSASRAAAWFELQSPFALTAFCAVFAAVAASAPLSVALVPLPLYTIVASRSRSRLSRQQLFAVFALLCFVLYATFGIDAEEAFVVRANVLHDTNVGLLLELGWRLVVALLERVFFETFFGISSRLWLANGLGAPWVVILLGLFSAAIVVAIYIRVRRQAATDASAAGLALYAVVALPALAVFGRWPFENVESWQSTTFRYFVPAAKLLVLALVVLTATSWSRWRRSRWAVGAFVAWIAALNLADNARYAGPLAPILASKSHTRLEHEVMRKEGIAVSRYALEQFAAIVHLARTLPPGERRVYTLTLWDKAVVVRGKGTEAP